MPRYRSAFSSFLLSVLLAAFLAPGVALGASLMPPGKQAYTDSSGNPLAGGKVYTYAAGTSTPLATYSDQAGITPNANPVVLDARGEATIFWSAGSGYKVTLRDSADALIWTQDNLYAAAGAGDTATFVGLRVADGTVGAPAYSWTNDTNSGFYLVANDDLALSIGGTKRAEWTASGTFSDTYNPLTAATTLTLKGNLAAGSAGSDVTLNTAATRTAGNILAVQNGGANRLRLTPSGSVVLGGTSGTISTVDATNLSLELRGNKAAADAGADVVVNSTVVRTAGNLLDVRNNSASRFTVDYNGQFGRSSLPTVGQQVSASSGTFTTANQVLTDVTNLTVTLVTTGRPVVLMIQPAGGTTASYFLTSAVSNGSVLLLRDGSGIARFSVFPATSFPSSFVALDVPTAASHTYKVQVSQGAAGTFTVESAVLVAYEL